MRRRPAYENLHPLMEDQVFSSEELDLIQQRIYEELEHDSQISFEPGEMISKPSGSLPAGDFSEKEKFMFELHKF